MTQETVQELDAALLRLPASPERPEDIEARAMLMARRIKLDIAARAPPPRAAPRTGLVLNVPPNHTISDIVDLTGQKYQVRMLDGSRVIEVTPAVFRALLAGPHGMDWETANQGSDVWQRMQPGNYVG